MESKVILKAEHITKQFPGVKALSDVSLEVREHEVLALLPARVIQSVKRAECFYSSILCLNSSIVSVISLMYRNSLCSIQKARQKPIALPIKAPTRNCEKHVKDIHISHTIMTGISIIICNFSLRLNLISHSPASIRLPAASVFMPLVLMKLYTASQIINRNMRMLAPMGIPILLKRG